MNKWVKFPHDCSNYTYQDKRLHNHWDMLHQGDKAPWPDQAWLTQQSAQAADEATALALQDAWRAYHRGDFAAAVSQAQQLGDIAHAVENKATGIYADYLEEDEAQQQQLYQQVVTRAERAIKVFPDDPNSHYFHAFGLGRYSQSISITKALSQGLAGKVKHSLETALALEPQHAEAHLAMGLFHAEIINKVGKLVGGMTYGASIDEALKHFDSALSCAPNLPIMHIEYGNGLYLLYGERRLSDMNAAYQNAIALTPCDAMQCLDHHFARSELES